MNIGVDAASLAMSNAVVASSDNVNSAYWNPAGLLNVSGKQAALMHASYFANIAQYDYAAFTMPIDNKSVLAASVIRFGVDNILNTTQLIDNQGNIDYNRVSLFSTADYGFTFSYARKTNVKNLNIGVNSKIIRRVIGKFADSWGFGFDIGLQYKLNNWKFGVMARDITTTYNVWSINKAEYETIKDAVSGQNQELPETTEITIPKIQIGTSRKFTLSSTTTLLTNANLNVRLEKTNDIISMNKMSVDPAAGFEFGYTDLIFVRTGVGNFQNIQQIDNTKKLGFQPNIGLGFKYKGIEIDYALTDIGNQSAALYSNIFSVLIDFSYFK